MKTWSLNIMLSIAILAITARVHGQGAFMDPATVQLFDSLDARIIEIQKKIPRLQETRSPKYFFAKQELDFTIFIRHYKNYVFEEGLEQASQLVESQLRAAKKRGCSRGIAFYKEYQKDIANEIKMQQEHYQNLFSKEKTFRKELYRYFNAGDQYSLTRAIRMTDLAMKYAAQKNLDDVLEYVSRYNKLAQAIWYDSRSEYDLEKMTRHSAYFEKQLETLIESDSIALIHKGGELVEHCFNYAANTNSVLDTNYFNTQKNAVNTSISDYYSRLGNNSSLASLGGQSVIARFDTLNREGVYKWQNHILVVGHFKPDGKFDNVRKGEAIIDADNKLAEYIRVNQLAKLGKTVKMGSTFMVPYFYDQEMQEFCFNPNEMKYQYMVCYTEIESQYLTKEISKLLPPLQFNVELADAGL